MFKKRLFQKAAHRHQEKGLMSDDVNLRINVHYGIPSTASILAFDPIQRLLAIGTLKDVEVWSSWVRLLYLVQVVWDGRIKIIGGDNIEGLLVSPKLLPFKYLEFMQNQGFLVSVTNDNDIQVWNLERRSIACSLQWESNVTAFSVISGSSFMYVGDEYGLMSVLKYDPDSGKLLQSHYQLSPDSLAGEHLKSHKYCLQRRHALVLIAYASGLIILWDVVEAHVSVVRGDKVLQLKNKVTSPNDADTNIVDEAPSHDLEEKEISALCWASTDGSVIAVGYIDGDILFWNTSKDSSIKEQEAGMSPNVVRLQLSSAEKRLPVIVLHWLDNSKSRNHREGQLLIYGGDEIGCEEVVTVLSLEWSSGMEAVKCIGRLNLTLTGSFADMILVPSADLQPGNELPPSSVKFPACIPTVDPLMTVAELFHIYGSSEAIGSKIAAMSSTLILPGNKKWPLTGGISNHVSFGEETKVHRLYVAGYQDGSVRVWDATHPVFSLLCVLTDEFNSESSGSSVTILDLCPSTLRLAVGSERGLIQLYNLHSSSKTSFHFITETKSEVRVSAQVQGPRCTAAFDLLKSGVQALKFTNNGSKLLVGYECSRIAVLDVHSSSVAFITDSIPNSPVISVFCKTVVYEATKSTNESSPKVPDNCRGELFLFILAKDGSIYVIDESQAAVQRSVDKEPLLKDDTLRNEPIQDGAEGNEKRETEDHSLDKNPSAQSLKELYVLLCCKDSLRVYPAKSVIQGESKSIYKVKLSKPCCWTTVFKKDEKVSGLVVFYQTGEMEIRSLPDMELVKEIPLMSYLRWNVKANMERMISSTENLLITLANGCEVAFVSLLEGENDFRIPESLPLLHDEVLAAAANAALSASSDPKRKQGGNPGILGGIVKGFRGRKSNKSMYHDSNPKFDFSHLDDIFIRNPFPEPSTTTDEQEATELTIDDIEIDDPVPSTSTLSHEFDSKDKDKKNEREQLLDDGGEIKPRLRTREEIIAKYRKAGKISRRTEDLRNGAEDFASLANELVKAMEKRKWHFAVAMEKFSVADWHHE
ncbi:hypothetical protein DH2020_048060 [Rehmannia glutinosa]|uniref:Uncharacterized protein n=1 Tax=Rehmannia glutinosa TaxID=99300 RepID=A0ABR0U7H4_REHGL